MGKVQARLIRPMVSVEDWINDYYFCMFNSIH